MRTRILVVEDERIVAEDIRATLESNGYTVTGIAATCDDALERIRQNKPDVVLMDIVLRGPADGVEAARTIGMLFSLPVVFLSSHADQATVRRATLSGPFGYILKPFEDRELCSVIELALHRHRAERRLEADQHWLSAILSSLGDGVLAADSMGIVRLANQAACHITGWPVSDIAGQDLAAVYRTVDPATGLAVELPPLAALMNSLDESSARRTLRLARRDGSLVRIEATIAAIHDGGRTFSGTVVLFHEVGEPR